MKMSDIGNQLLQPEVGWKRLDFINTDTNIEFSSNFQFMLNRSDAFNGTFAYLPTGIIDGYIKFNFIGSKIRIISATALSRATNSSITIDGIEEYMPYMYNNDSTTRTYILVYEKLNLPYQEHSVIIKSGTDGSFTNLQVDALDIDENGELKPYNPNLFKYLIKQQDKYYSIKDGNPIELGIPMDNDQLERWFNDYGIYDINNLCTKYSTESFVSSGETLGDGKLFTFSVPNNIKNINNID